MQTVFWIIQGKVGEGDRCDQDRDRDTGKCMGISGGSRFGTQIPHELLKPDVFKEDEFLGETGVRLFDNSGKCLGELPMNNKNTSNFVKPGRRVEAYESI